jgi:acyl-CoA thioesterase FadM
MTFKKPLRTPQVVVVRGQIRKVEGRKLFVKGSCEDKDGATFAEADGLWVTVELPQAAQKRKASTSGQTKI